MELYTMRMKCWNDNWIMPKCRFKTISDTQVSCIFYLKLKNQLSRVIYLSRMKILQLINRYKPQKWLSYVDLINAYCASLILSGTF